MTPEVMISERPAEVEDRAVFDVASVNRTGPGQVQILIEMRSREAACPACGVLLRR